MNHANQNELLELLTLLSEWLAIRHPSKSWTLAIVGGGAMALAGQKETTVDIDVISPFPLPKEIIEGALAVAKSKRMSPSWLSEGPGSVFAHSVPVHERLHFFVHSKILPIGQNLSLALPSRQTLISSKLFAASPSLNKHTQDIARLKPSSDEIREAVRFVRACDNSNIRREDLQLLLKTLGFNANDFLE